MSVQKGIGLVLLLLPFFAFSQVDDEFTPHWDHDTLRVKQGLYLYPNPARDYIYIQFEEEVDRIREIGIFNTSGKEVNCWVPSPRIESEKKIFLWTGDLVEGAYFYRIFTMDEIYTGRFIVSRQDIVQ